MRTFYKPIMKSGKGFVVSIPKEVVDSLQLEDRDELELTAKKTGRKVSKSTRFKRGVDASTEQNAI